MKYSGGLIKDGKQVSYVLIGLVAVIITLVLVFSGMNNRGKVTKEEVEQLIQKVPPPKLVELERIQ